MNEELDKLLSDKKNFYFLKRVIDSIYYVGSISKQKIVNI